MKYEAAGPTHLFLLAEEVGKKHGFHFLRGAEAFKAEERVWGNIVEHVDRSFLAIVDTSHHSWWVSLELYRALEHKYCILLISDDLIEPQVPPPIAEFKHLHYSLGSRSTEKDFQSQLAESLRHVLHLAATWCGKVSERSIEDGTRELPTALVNPELKLGEQEVSVDQFFGLFLKAGPRRVAVVARSGLGKTVLLTRLAGWLRREPEWAPIHTKQLGPLVVFLRAADLPADVKLAEYVKDHVLRRQPRHPDRNWCSEEWPSLFESYRAAGRICVIVDALDEFFVLNRGKTEHLTQELDDLFRRNFSVVVSCRQNLWVQQIRRKEYETLQITFTEEQANCLLAGVNLPTTAKVNGRLRSFLLNPLILSFIKTAYDESKSVLSFASRSNLYESWAKWECSRESPLYGVDAERLLRLFGAVALEMLRNRRDRLLIGDLPHILAACGFERPLSEPELSARGVVEKKVVEDLKEVLEFVHPSIYEYFLAHRLKADFLGVEKAEISPEQLSNLELGRVELDFPQSAVYGFLSELLGDEYFHILKIRLRQTFREAAPSMLARNLVEYLGMTFRGGSDPELVRLLLDYIEDSRLSARVRFDAARALERVCPLAPYPYFEHVSDWGAHEYRDLVAIAGKTTERPWVIRGYRRDAPGVGKHWAWIDNAGKWPDTMLQQEASRRLGSLLEQLLRDSSDPAVQVNVSHAWIRWYHPADRVCLDMTRVQAARNFEQSRDLENQAIYENLRDWVGKYYSVGFSEASARSIRGV